MALVVTSWADNSVLTALIQPVPPPQLDEVARVVADDRLPTECLAPVEITRIDGETQVVPAQGFVIEPGYHALNGRALLDTGDCRPLDARQYMPPVEDLVMEFEAGKSYHIAFDRSHEDPDRWGLVVWKEEQTLVDSNAAVPEPALDRDLSEVLLEQDPGQ